MARFTKQIGGRFRTAAESRNQVSRALAGVLLTVSLLFAQDAPTTPDVPPTTNGPSQTGVADASTPTSPPETEAPVVEYSASAVTLPDAGEVRVNPQDEQRYVFIPAGYFEQGCVARDTGCKGDERPRRVVRISTGFWIRESEVTVGEYQAFAKAKRIPMPWPPPSGPALIPLLPPPSFNTAWREKEQPMLMLGWEAAETYCREYAGGRLPTEAEWEYAARAGEAGKIYGDSEEITRADANYGASKCCKPRAEEEDAFTFAAPVKSFPANPWGLYDMKGNAWEWTSDWYAADAYEGGETADPKGPADGTEKVIRGGAFDNTPDQLRVSERHTAKPATGTQYIGFRCVHLDLPVNSKADN